MSKTLTSLILLTILTAGGICSAAAQESKIDIQKGEKWWGIIPGESLIQPITESFGYNLHAQNDSRAIFLSTAGRYIYAERPSSVNFDGKTFNINADEKVSAVKAGKTLREAYLVCCHKHFRPSGKLPEMTLFTRPVYETRIELGQAQGEQALLKYASKILSEGFPAGTIIIADGWQSASSLLKPDPLLYPDPKRLVDELHRMGFRVVLTVTPLLATAGKTYQQAAREGKLLSAETSPPEDTRVSRPSMVGADADGITPMAVWNIGRADVYTAMREALESLSVLFPVDAFRFDAGEASGLIASLDPQFGQNWIKLTQAVPTDDIVGGRTATFPDHIFSPDAAGYIPDPAFFISMLSDIVCSGLVGHPYVHIATYYSDSPYFSPHRHNTPQLFNDAKNMAALLSMQACLPVATVDFAPWRIADLQLYNGVKKMFAYREKIAEYVKTLTTASGNTGEPLLRHMEYQFPRSGFSDCNDQFMLGPRYMFAPAMGRDKRMVRIPKGVWTDGNGKRYKGPLVTQVDSVDPLATCFELTDHK